MWDWQPNALKFSFNRVRPAQLDEWIHRLLSTKVDDNFLLDSYEVETICRAAVKVMRKEPCVLKIKPANDKGCWHIVGDVHGQYHDLLNILETHGLPPTTEYIFLGDYVDRGPRSLEVMTLLLALKLRWPDHVHLLRGNHETSSMTQIFGFRDECNRRCSEFIWQEFIEVFNVMPLVAHISKPTNTLLVHGGISPHIEHLDEIDQKISKPIDWTPTGNDILTDLLWSDPSDEIEMWGSSPRGTSFHWGMTAARKFMDSNSLQRIVRGHTAEHEGFSFMGDKHEIVTVHSAPNYQGGDCDGCIMVLETDGQFRMEKMHRNVSIAV